VRHFDDTLDDLSVQERARRRRLLNHFYGWRSWCHLVSDWTNMARPYWGAMNRASRLSPEEMARRILYRGELVPMPPTALGPRAVMEDIDEFALVFRHVRRKEAILALTRDWSLSENQLGIILHNARLLVVLLWVPHYFRPRSPRYVWQEHTPVQAQQMLVQHGLGGEAIVVACTDNAEGTLQHSSDLVLQLLTYSSKLGHANTWKLSVITTLTGLALWRAFLYGGGAKEVSPLTGFSLPEALKAALLVLFADRGYRDLHATERLLPVLPFFLDAANPQFPARNVAIMKVLQRRRSVVECFFKHLKDNKSIGSTRCNTEIPGLEMDMEVAIAVTNMRRFWPEVLPAELQATPEEVLEHAILILRNWQPAETAAVPAALAHRPTLQHSNLFQHMLDAVPRDWPDWLLQRSQALLDEAVLPEEWADTLSLEGLEVHEQVPSQRALQLVEAHFLSMVEVGQDIHHHMRFHVLGEIRPSVKKGAYLTHVQFGTEEGLVGALCSCPVGQEGCCSHMQYLLLTLIGLADQQLLYCWSTQKADPEPDRQQRLIPYLLARQRRRAEYRRTHEWRGDVHPDRSVTRTYVSAPIRISPDTLHIGTVDQRVRDAVSGTFPGVPCPVDRLGCPKYRTSTGLTRHIVNFHRDWAADGQHAEDLHAYIRHHFPPGR
jgi:hypothetical protein